MKTDVSKITFDGEYVKMPLDVYKEIYNFARGHGETDLIFYELWVSQRELTQEEFEFPEKNKEEFDRIMAEAGIDKSKLVEND